MDVLTAYVWATLASVFGTIGAAFTLLGIIEATTGFKIPRLSSRPLIMFGIGCLSVGQF